jgi:hypothetical protein
MTQETLKLALEALTYIYTETTADEDELIHAAITALREALAQPKQEPLTDEAIYAMCDDFHGWSEWDGGEYQRLWLNLCRAIEAAHDIKEIT